MTSSDYEETDSIDIYDDGQKYDDDDFNHLSRLSLQNVRKRMKKLFYDDGNIPSHLKHNIKYLHGFKEQGVKIRKFRCSSTEVIFKISAKKKTIKSGKYTNFIAKLNSRITPNEKDFLDQLSKVFSSANNTLKIDSDNYDQWNFFGKKYEIRFIRTTVKAITSYLVQLRHIEDINTIQELLDNLSPNSDIFEVSTTIFQISTAKNIDDFSLCMLFYCTTSCRPFQNEIQAELIAQFTKRKQESFRTQLAKIYLSHITSSTNFFIIRELMKLDVLHKDEVLEYVYYSQSVRAHFWFVADADDHEAYKIDGNGKNKIADDLFDLLQINQISHGFQYFPKHYQEFKELQKNNWEILRKYIEIGYNPDILATTIRNDDIDTFQQLLTNESGQYHFNKRIRPSIFDRHLIFHYKPTLIQYAALFGSIKIFKYLLLNNTDLYKSDKNRHGLFNYAIAGGNHEIIHICKQKGLPTNDILLFSVIFRNLALYDWIKETGLDIRSNRQHSSVLYNAIMHFNFPIILDTLDEIPQLTNFLLHCGVLDNREVYQLFQEVEHTSHLTYLSSLIYSLNNNLLKNEFTKANATLNQSLFQTLLGMLIKINDIEIYNYFSSFAHDLSKNKDIFELAVESNAWRIVKLIVQDEKFDVDLYINNNNRINFRNNISNRQIALYRDFLEIKGFDINKTYTSTGGSVFSLLTWCGAVNLVKYVYNISSFNINKRGAIGETPLTGCSLNNLPELAGFLVSLKGIKVNKKNKSHLNTPIEIALQKQHVDVILALLNHPELIFNSEDLIKFACKRNDLELAQKIVNHTKFETEKWDIYLNEIIKSQSQNVFQVLYDLYLRDNHIKITHSHNKDKYNKKTLLCAFKVAVVKLSDVNLYKKYFNSNDLSNELEEITNQKLTKSPLFYALKNPNCLAYLLNKTNLDPNVVDKKGFTLIQKAVQTKSHHSIQVLIEDQRVVLDFRDKEYLINESEKNVRNLLLESNRLKFNSIDIRKFGINIQIIQNLLQFGFNDMNFVQKYDYLSPLQLSIEEGNIELFSYILTLSGINFNLNGTLIHLMNHFDIQEFISFINNKQINIDVNYYDDNYYTALIHATSNNQLEYIHALLEHPDIKIDLVVRNVSALSCVITIEACELLIKHGAKAINYVNLQGITPLCYSIKNNQDGLFNYLINLNMIDYTKENNCFSASLKNENKKYFEIISTKEIKPDRQSLVFAIDHIDHYLLSIILPHFGPLDGFLPLANADEKTLQILFDHGFDFSIIPESFERRDSRYLLLTAVEENNLCLVQRILTYENIQINFTDERGEFPLGIALYNGYHKIALLLLRQPGINVNLLFHNEYPPIMIVAQLKTIHHSIQIELIELILKNSHEMLNFERNGKTALSLALEKRNILVIHFLQNIPNIKIAPSIVGYCIMQKNIELFKIILHSQEYLLIEKEIQNIFACKFYEAVSLLTNDDRIKCNDFSFLEHSSIKYESPKNIIRDFVLSKADCNNPNIVRNLMKYSFCIYSPFQSIVQKIDNINEVYKGVTHLMFSLEEHFLNEAFAFIVDPRIDFYIPNKHGKNVLQMNFNDYPDLQNLLITIQNLKQKLPS